VYLSAWRYDDALPELRAAIRIDGETTSTLCYLAFALAKSGRRPEAEAILSKLTASTRYVSPMELGIVYMGLGDHEHALRLLEDAYTARDLQLQFLGVDVTYDAIRSDPRYRDLMRRVGLPDWRRRAG
jgi:tetratricopeptide (TPR) repeat protein